MKESWKKVLRTSDNNLTIEEILSVVEECFNKELYIDSIPLYPYIAGKVEFLSLIENKLKELKIQKENDMRRESFFNDKN